MPTKTLFGKTFDARPDRIDLRDLPYRAPLKNLPPQFPTQEMIDDFLPLYAKTKMLLDQGKEGACTGFGLAAVVNYLRWEYWVRDNVRARRSPNHGQPAPKVSPRMLYQNARLYDEWKGEDYEGSSCRGAMKGFHKHGVCGEETWPYRKAVGRPKDNWREDAALTPLGAYYRIDTGSIADLQAAIHEVHSIYVSAVVHDGWDLAKCKSLDEATIGDPTTKERGGHAFALVGYTPKGFIVQNSWGPDWGYHGFGLLRYGDFSTNATDAWAIALGAPIADMPSPPARTAISLEERARMRCPLNVAAKDKKRTTPFWVESEEADHIVFIGHGGRADREIVSASDPEDAVRHVVEHVVEAAATNGEKIAIYAHGGLNSRDSGVKRAQILGPWLQANKIRPLFVVWQTGFLESASDILRTALARQTPEEQARRVEGWMLDLLEEQRDRAFEVFARDFGVKAIWENMKSRADLASGKGGGMNIVAAALSDAFGQLKQKAPELHLLGHSAGAIMHGNFIKAAARAKLNPKTIHLWAPACTVDFALQTYGEVLGRGGPKIFVSLLADTSEKSDESLGALYSKSLLYLVSRALEPDHKTPILGMQKIWTGNNESDDTFNREHVRTINAWRAKSRTVTLLPVITGREVPTRRRGGKVETIPADHGSFDNNLNVVNAAIELILGKAPPVPVTDLKGL